MFNEITERAVKAAFQHPGKIDTNKVDAQQARRVLDRLVGYKLSPAALGEDPAGLSAGRVQSVAVRLITEREREILAFVPEEYWSLHARLKGKNPPEFIATLQRGEGREGRRCRTRPTTHGGDDRRCTARPWPVKTVDARRAPAEPVAAVHHLHAPAGGEPQAPLHAPRRP